jgi:RNA polymerase sigma factor (sigma-70 family)
MAANIVKFPPDGPFDEDYLARLRKGDYETAQHFHEYFRKRLRIMLCGAFGTQVINDLIDEVMFVAIANIMRGEPRDPARLPQYVRGVCKNLKNRTIRNKPKDGSEDIDFDRISGSERTAEEQLQRQETARDVQAVLKKLSERDRNILIDLFFNELTREEVCAKYAPMSREQLRMILFHARERFQGKWRKKNEDQQNEKD